MQSSRSCITLALGVVVGVSLLFTIQIALATTQSQKLLGRYFLGMLLLTFTITVARYWRRPSCFPYGSHDMNKALRRALLTVGAAVLIGLLATVAIATLLLHTVIHTSRISTTLYVYAGVLFAIALPLSFSGVC